jgi:hypothetical protein
MAVPTVFPNPSQAAETVGYLSLVNAKF